MCISYSGNLRLRWSLWRLLECTVCMYHVKIGTYQGLNGCTRLCSKQNTNMRLYTLVSTSPLPSPQTFQMFYFSSWNVFHEFCAETLSRFLQGHLLMSTSCHILCYDLVSYCAKLHLDFLGLEDTYSRTTSTISRHYFHLTTSIQISNLWQSCAAWEYNYIQPELKWKYLQHNVLDVHCLRKWVFIRFHVKIEMTTLLYLILLFAYFIACM